MNVIGTQITRENEYQHVGNQWHVYSNQNTCLYTFIASDQGWCERAGLWDTMNAMRDGETRPCQITFIVEPYRFALHRSSMIDRELFQGDGEK